MGGGLGLGGVARITTIYENLRNGESIEFFYFFSTEKLTALQYCLKINGFAV